MRVVIDTNCLESDELRVFLKQQRSDQICASYSVLSEFPKQVIILKANRFSAGIDPRVPAISSRFIDREATRSFATFCGILDKVKTGHLGYVQQLAKRQKWARERVKSIEDGLGDQSDALTQVRSFFHEHDLRRLAAGEGFSQQSLESIVLASDYLAEQLADRQPISLTLPRPPHRFNAFTWRYALSHLIQLVRLLSRGAVRRAPAKARNDHFDNVFATFGTYYNGLMTNDAELLRTLQLARFILKSLGARLAEDYVESGYILTVLEELQSNSAGPSV